MTPEQAELLRPLTRLQKGIVTALIRPGVTPLAAYREAGGTAKSDRSASACVSEILTNPNVRAALDALRGAAVTSAVATRTEVLEFLTRAIRTPLTALATVEKVPVETDEETGEVLTTVDVWSMRDEALSDPLTMTLLSELGGKQGPKFKAQAQLQAAQMLAKMQGWEAPAKIDATVRTAKPAADMDPLEAARAYQDLMGS